MIKSVTVDSEPGVALLALHHAFPDRYPVLLDSAASGTSQGRYSILMARPGERLDCGRPGPHSVAVDRFLDRLDAWWRRERPLEPVACPGLPFSGGWFLLLGYELAAGIEAKLHLPAPPEGEESMAWRMRAAVVLDHRTGLVVAVAEPTEKGFADQVSQDLRDVSGWRPSPATGDLKVVEDDPALFLTAVQRAKAHIAAGDIYQANISRAWRGALPPILSPAELYGRLRRANPGPFSGVAALGDLWVVSSSPERLVKVEGRGISTRPIAGTRPRLGPTTDVDSISELVGHPKERAEHIMLIDLERNDLGRLCRAGTVRVEEFMTVESYAHVHHIVSEVSGTLRDEATPGAVIRGLFPGGTITGCPKFRCMQIIAELEGEGRGAYTGSMGYLGRDGSMDLNILIRTLSVRDGRFTLRAGSGIVADSEPMAELAETRAKARGVLRALEAGA